MGRKYPNLDVPKVLVELLYVRARWSLPAGADVPPVTAPPPAVGPPRPAHELAPVWEALWTAALDALSTGLLPVGWRESQGVTEAEAADLDSWAFSHVERITRAEMERYPTPPPEVTLGELTIGIAVVDVLPLAGPYARWLTPSHLLVSEATRSAGGAYRTVLMR